MFIALLTLTVFAVFSGCISGFLLGVILDHPVILKLNLNNF